MVRVRLARDRVELGSLPDWPFWRFISTRSAERDGEIWLEEDQNNLSVGYLGWVALCTIKNPDQWVQGDPNSPRLNQKPLFIEPELVSLPKEGTAVDMNPELGEDYLELMRNEVLFGEQSLHSFVRRVLSRARSSWDIQTYSQELIWMLKAPIELDEFWESPRDEHIETRLYDWMSARPKGEAKRTLLRRDTQIQIILMLELESLGDSVALPPEAEGLVYEHFARLCIWQALDFGETDHVWEFATQVVMPNFRSSTPNTCDTLYSKARGVAYADQKPPRLSRRTKRSKSTNDFDHSNSLVDALTIKQEKNEVNKHKRGEKSEKTAAGKSRSYEPSTPKRAKQDRTIRDPSSPSPRKRSMIRLSFPSWSPSKPNNLGVDAKKRRVSQKQRIEPEKLAKLRLMPQKTQENDAIVHESHTNRDEDHEEAIGSDTEDGSVAAPSSNNQLDGSA